MKKKYYEPLRPHRFFGQSERYEFTHGTDSVCVYDLSTLKFVKEIPVGKRPDCHATTCDNRYLYIACQDGLYCISQENLEVAAVLDTGHVYGTNVLPDGETMLLHDAYGGIQVIKNIQTPSKLCVYKRLPVTPWNDQCLTLGGKGNFIRNNRYYLVAGWENSSVYALDLENDYQYFEFVQPVPQLYRSDDLVISADETHAVAACYGAQGFFSIIHLASRQVVQTIPSGNGTCGLTMSAGQRYVFSSNDGEDAIVRLDMKDWTTRKFSCRPGFESLGLKGYLQGISIGTDDSIYVYNCSGDGAIAHFIPNGDSMDYHIASPYGMAKGACVTAP